MLILLWVLRPPRFPNSKAINPQTNPLAITFIVGSCAPRAYPHFRWGSSTLPGRDNRGKLKSEERGAPQLQTSGRSRERSGSPQPPSFAIPAADHTHRPPAVNQIPSLADTERSRDTGRSRVIRSRALEQVVQYDSVRLWLRGFPRISRGIASAAHGVLRRSASPALQDHRITLLGQERRAPFVRGAALSPVPSDGGALHHTFWYFRRSDPSFNWPAYPNSPTNNPDRAEWETLLKDEEVQVNIHKKL